jgi:hypothetical protein
MTPASGKPAMAYLADHTFIGQAADVPRIAVVDHV